MKRTLEQLLAGFNAHDQEKRDREVQKVLDEQIRPHVLNLENWSMDDLYKIRCAPIRIDKPQGMGERYQIYHQAWNLMSAELMRGNPEVKDKRYLVSYGGSSWDITPNIYVQDASELQYEYVNESATIGQDDEDDPPPSIQPRTNVVWTSVCPESAESIFKKTWAKYGQDFEGLLQKEADRLVAFLSNPDNWDPETRKSKPFAWADPLKYTRYDSFKEVKRLALLQLGTEKLTLEFNDSGINTMSAKIKGVATKKVSTHCLPPDDESDI